MKINCNLSEITELKFTSLIKIIILEENFKWHLEAFASELFINGWPNEEYSIYCLFHPSLQVLCHLLPASGLQE